MSKLFSPTSIPVTLNAREQPQTFVWRGKRQWVRRVCNHWRIESEWWSEPVARDYYKLFTGDGLICVIYQDRLQGGWYFERLFD